MQNPVKDWLKTNKVSQEKLARKMNVSFNFINSIVNAKNTNIKVTSLYQLHQATGIPYTIMIEYFNTATLERSQVKTP